MKGDLSERIEPKNAPRDLLRAAGGIIWRAGKNGRLEVAVCHRPHREDWTFPKGKLDEGETYEDAALREVIEETGFTCRLEEFIGTTEYMHRKGQLKVVAYWLMSVKKGTFAPNDEVDELRWVTPSKARGLLTFERDADLLEHLNELIEDVA